MKRKILIMGAGVYQVPLIRKARDMGLETIVVSPRGTYPGIPLADVFLDLDTTDADGILAAVRDLGISGVATTGTDVCVPSMGRIVDALGLPGTGHAAACRSMDKVLMKRAFRERQVPTASFDMFTDLAAARAFADRSGYPVMVKATDSSGSRGITKVDRPEAMEAAWDRARAISRSKQVIVEEFLSGLEFGAQAFVHGDRVAAVFPHGDTVTPAPYFTPIGHSMPTRLTGDQQSQVAVVIEQAVRAVGLRDCVSNVDLMLVDGQPKIIEIGARMGATCLPESISIYSGMDAYEHVIRLALGEHPPVSTTARQANASLLLRSERTGILAALEVPEEVREHPGLVDLQWDVSIGDPVRAFEVGPDRIGHLIVKADSAEDGERLVEHLASLLHIDVREPA
jgi:biotin carboxylase